MRALTAMAMLVLVVGSAAATGVAYIEGLWEDIIATDAYSSASGDPSHYPTDWMSAPEGIYGWTLKSDGDSCNWVWVRARAEDNPEIKRWVHTSTWAQNIYPYWSCFYCVNKSQAWNYVPMGHKYYMSSFRWHPIYVQRVPPQPVSEPDNPGNRTSAYVSPVYLTEHKYDYPGQGGSLQQVADLYLQNLVNW